MLLFILGLAMLFGIHMLPFYPDYRALLIEKLENDYFESEDLYKIVFSVVSLLGLIFAAVGKSSIAYIGLWDTPIFLRYAAILFVFIAFVLMIAAYLPSNIKQHVPHPMLTGIIIWAATHVLVNGDLVSIIFFTSFIVYSVVAIKLSNQRALSVEDNENRDDGIITIKQDAIVIGAALLGLLVLLWLHKPLFGRAVFI